MTSTDSTRWMRWLIDREARVRLAAEAELLQAVPVIEKLLLVQLSPRLGQATLAYRERARDDLDGLDADHSHLILSVSVEMR